MPERGPHSSGVFPRVHRPPQAARFARNPSVQEVVSCTAPVICGAFVLTKLTLGLCGLTWAGLSDSSNLCTVAAAWGGTRCPALHSGRKPTRGEAPFCSPKAISQPHRAAVAVGIKGTHSVVHSERTRAPLQAFCHLCHCSKCEETIFVCQKNKYLFGVVFLAAKHILSSLCGNSGF